jgi:WD40 repeat protein
VAVGVEPAKEGDPVRVRVFDVETGRERTPLTVAGATTLFTLAYSPDGNRLAAVAALYDKDKNRLSARLVVWEPHGGEPTVAAELFRDAKVSALGYASTFRAGVVWTPDGSRLVVSHGRPLNAGFAVHDAATGEPVVTLERPVNRSGLFPTGVVCSPDGKRVAAFLSTGGNEQPAVKMWDVVIGKEVLTLRKQQVTERRLGGPPRSKDRQLAFTADGHRLLGWEFGEVPEWSPETGTVMVPAYNRSVWDASPPPEAKK